MPLSVFTIESVARILVIAKDSGTIACKTGSPFVQFISREISQVTSSLTFSTLNSRLDTRKYQGSSIKSRGSRLEGLSTYFWAVLYTTCSNKMSSQIYSCSVHHLLESPSSLPLSTLKKDRQITFFTVYTVYVYKIYIENDWWNAKICNFSIAVTKLIL